jgi:hypothetical protein
MMLDRFAMERMARERQVELLREADEPREAPRAPVARRAVGTAKPRRRWAMETTSLRRRLARLAGVAALALALLVGGLLGLAADEAAASAASGGGGGAIGYVP